MTYQDDVKEFHLAGGQVVNDKPTVPSRDTVFLRGDLLVEEFGELDDALVSCEEKEDLVEVLSEAVDLVYVIMGLCVSLGLPFDEAWKATQEANMAKFKDGIHLRPDGKILKPDGWKPADIAAIVEEAGWEDGS